MNEPKTVIVEVDSRPGFVRSCWKFVVVVFLILLVLKLAGIGTVAAWSWWWVTLPLWAPFAVFVAGGVVVFFVALLCGTGD